MFYIVCSLLFFSSLPKFSVYSVYSSYNVVIAMVSAYTGGTQKGTHYTHYTQQILCGHRNTPLGNISPKGVIYFITVAPYILYIFYYRFYIEIYI